MESKAFVKFFVVERLLHKRGHGGQQQDDPPPPGGQEGIPRRPGAPPGQGRRHHAQGLQEQERLGDCHRKKSKVTSWRKDEYIGKTTDRDHHIRSQVLLYYCLFIVSLSANGPLCYYYYNFNFYILGSNFQIILAISGS